MDWIEVAPGAPYFETAAGAPWTPVGQNDAISWPDLKGLFRRRDLPAAGAYLRYLAEHGVTCLRLMLEYAQIEHRYLEQPAGTFKPAMVQLFDDLFALCERYGLRILATPFDTFWMWRRWRRHPYNRANGGPCQSPRQLLLCPATRAAMKARLDFATRRWGHSGVLFAWDLWNEMHPAHAGDSAGGFEDFIADMSEHLRRTEREVHGRSHPQTVSVFGPHIVLDSARISDAVFRQPALDFASTHFYEEDTIDDPQNTVDAAISTGRLMREALAQIRDTRPFFDSEHGPIHTYKDHHKTLPEAFDDEYFRHMQWAHLASGGAGGGMRWPNRKPHSLTHGMRQAQRSMSAFLPLIEWRCFRRRNWNNEVSVSEPHPAVFASGDASQALVWLLRRDTIGRDGRVRADASPVSVRLALPEFAAGNYELVAWDTAAGRECARLLIEHGGGRLQFDSPAFGADLAMAIRAR